MAAASSDRSVERLCRSSGRGTARTAGGDEEEGAIKLGAVHQFIPYLRRGDALGNHAIALRRFLRELGPSELYVEHAERDVASLAVDYREFRPDGHTSALYHAAIGSIMSGGLLQNVFPLGIDYHNVTPARYLAPYDPRGASLTLAGRIEIGTFADRASLAVAHSEYSRKELEELGFPMTAVAPVLLDPDQFSGEPTSGLRSKLLATKKGTDLLFVGRLSPHKRQEDVIKVFYAYKNYFDPGARLFLVGGGSAERYTQTLESFIRELGLTDVHLTGSVRQSDLLAYYSVADVFVSMSEHEGFCVPLIEAMKLGVPVVAYAAAAVPETLGEAGLLVNKKDYAEIAELTYRLVSDAEMRDRIMKAGRLRVDALDPEIHGPKLARMIHDKLTA